MAATGTFLGLDFHFSGAMIVDSRLFKSGVASKLYLELGMFGKVGAGGSQAIKDRQLQRGQGLTRELLASLEVAQAVSRPMRRYDLWWHAFHRVLAASDAAEDETKKGSRGFHLVFLDATQDRQSFVAVVDDSLYNQIQEGDHHIAQLELAMILYGLLARPAQFRGRGGYGSSTTQQG